MRNAVVFALVEFAIATLVFAAACVFGDPAFAQTVPATTQEQAAAVRTRLASAVDAAMPAVHCPTTAASTILGINGATRVVACGQISGWQVAVIQGLGLTMAQLNVTMPRAEALETATLYAAYLESVVASRHAPVELTFEPVTVVALR